MRLVKVLNTSVVLALNNQEEEIIVMGKGIGFRKSIGDSIQANKEDKIFTLKNNDISKQIIQLAIETDAEIFTLTKEIIDYAIKTYHFKLRDSIYLALTDHLAFAIQRAKEGLELSGLYSVEVKLYYPEEYEIGLHTLEQIHKFFDIKLPESEISNIAFHFINAKEHMEKEEPNRIQNIVKNILSIIVHTFHITYQENTVTYTRFLTHVQAMVQRVLSNQQLKEDPSMNLGELLSNSLNEELLCAEKISNFLKVKVQKKMTSYEKIYLAIHIHRIIEESVSNSFSKEETV